MGGHRAAACRRGHRGKLTGDPAIELAGVAVRFGLDPLEYLALAPEDARIATAALSAASRQQVDQHKAYMDYLAARTASSTTTGFAQVMRGFIKALRGRI